MPLIQHSDKLFIGGTWITPDGTGHIEVRSPATEEVIGQVPAASRLDVDRAVAAARHAFDDGPWPLLSFAERAGYLRHAAKCLRDSEERLAQITTAESGIPITQTRIQCTRPATILDYYAELGESLEQEERRTGATTTVTVRREPVGVAGIITPWNAPAALAHFSLGPALLAGCTIVLKTPAEAPLHGHALAEIYESAGLPAGVLNVLAADRQVSAALSEHPDVDKISFTGSSATGRRIAATCAENLTRITLELGGKSAAIILDDADVDATMPGLGIAATQNNCEACVGQTRILAPRHRYQEIVDAFTAELDKKRVGDPHDPQTDIGPLISAAQRDRCESYIKLGVEEGATLARSGGRPAELVTGHYVQPAVFTHVDNGMRIAQEEVFGPVFVIIPFDGDDDAVRIANASAYGLSGTVWTSDRARGMEIARRVRTGNFGVNTFGLEINSPFGGFKKSGIGRQLGREGLDAYFEFKSIHEPLIG